jgi:RND superfamily putative drug exporter
VTVGGVAPTIARRTLDGVLVRLCRWVLARRWWVLAGCAALAILGGLCGRGLFERLEPPLLTDPSSESSREAELVRTQLGESDPDVVPLWRLPSPVSDPAVHDALAAALARAAADPSVARAVGATGLEGDRFVSADGRSTFAVISLRGDGRARSAAVERLRPQLALALPNARIEPQLGGLQPTARALTRLAARSLRRGEELALPITALLLVLLFRGLYAAALPLTIGALGIVLALATLALLSRLFAVDAFAVNVVTILGLGVAIDYALFIVDRYREERRRTAPADALERAMATAGRSVLFSGVTVAASLSGLFVFRQPFLRSLAAGGIAVTLLAASLALVALPAMLGALGERIDRGRVLPHRKQRVRVSFWTRLSTAVIRHRVSVCVVVTLLLLTLAAPFRRVHPSRADVRALPADAEPRRVAEAIERDFPAVALLPDRIVVVFDDDVTHGDRLGALWDYTERLKRVPGAARVESILSWAHVPDRDGAEELAVKLTGRHVPELHSVLAGRYVLVQVVPKDPPDASASRDRVRALRAVPPPPGAHALMGGPAATLSDFLVSLRTRVPFMLMLVGAAMFAILFAAFRSLVQPVNAMVLTALSLTASFGAAVFIFQDGRFERLLRYQTLGTTEATLPIVMFAVIFGLSMDYEVLILSRIREAWLRSGDNDRAIVEGLTQTGRLVTGAALLMGVVFSAFAAAPLTFVKGLGLGMALAVALDATVVRMLLVPSTMALLGKVNWWSPRVRRG